MRVRRQELDDEFGLPSEIAVKDVRITRISNR
jgi:hypothetical protein